MQSESRTTTVRNAASRDAAELCSLLNAIILRGGTTAYRDPLSPKAFADHFLDHPRLISCVVAEASNGELLGFQKTSFADYLDDQWGDIATFAKLGNTQGGIGTLMFTRTLELSRLANVVALNATIRSYNAGGLAFYRKMGFVEYKRLPVEAADGEKPAEMIFHKRDV